MAYARERTMADRTAREAAVETMTDARERLVEAMVRAVIEDDDYWAEPEGTQNCREEQGRALDAFLAYPDDLRSLLPPVPDDVQIAGLVERGALDHAGYACTECGAAHGSQVRHYTRCSRPTPVPVYRQVREEGE